MKKVICGCGAIIECADNSTRSKCDACIKKARQAGQRITSLKLIIKIKKTVLQ